MDYYFFNNFQCNSITQWVLAAISCITLVVFLPTASAATLVPFQYTAAVRTLLAAHFVITHAYAQPHLHEQVFHHANPDSKALSAKSTGRPQFRYTIGRILIILAVRFGDVSSSRPHRSVC